MAHFYGNIQGARGPASRLGTKTSGLETVAASWNGAVSVELYEEHGRDLCRIWLRPWHGHGVRKLIYHGPVGEYAPLQTLELQS